MLAKNLVNNITVKSSEYIPMGNCVIFTPKEKKITNMVPKVLWIEIF